MKKWIVALALALGACASQLSIVDKRDTVVMVNDNCSGFFVSNTHVATAAHCVDAVNQRVKITTRDGRTFEGTVMVDADDQDVALIALDKPQQVVYAELNCKYEPLIEDRVTVIGHPAMVFRWAVSQGYIAGWGKMDAPGFEHFDYLWFTAQVYGGNSGGPVIHNGRVIGIVSATLSGLFNSAVHIRQFCKVFNG